MKNIIVEIPRAGLPKLLSRSEMLKVDGIYASDDSPCRFVTSQGSCFIFGDGCPLYTSLNFNSDHPRYFKVEEKIVFVPIKN